MSMHVVLASAPRRKFKDMNLNFGGASVDNLVVINRRKDQLMKYRRGGRRRERRSFIAVVRG